MIDKTKVKNILLITLSNVGDCILTTPVVSVLKKEFPEASLSIMVGPRAKEVFDGDPGISTVIIYDKFISWKEKFKLALKLRRENFDLVVDLRNSAFPFILNARYTTSPFNRIPRGVLHKRQVHLLKLKPLGLNIKDAPFRIWISQEDQKHIHSLLYNMGIEDEDLLVAVNPGAGSSLKRWKPEGYAEVMDRLIEELEVKVIMTGDLKDQPLIGKILGHMRHKPHDFSGKTTIRQLAALLNRSRLLIANDSATLHLGSTIGLPILTIFGPTDPRKYGPCVKKSILIRRYLPCSPCERAQCLLNHECMDLIEPEEVLAAAKRLLEKDIDCSH